MEDSTTAKIPLATPQLLDKEAQLAAEHRALVSRATLQIEAIMLLHDLTMGDLLEIFGLFSSRANSVFEKIKIKKIKEDYGKI